MCYLKKKREAEGALSRSLEIKRATHLFADTFVLESRRFYRLNLHVPFFVPNKLGKQQNVLRQFRAQWFKLKKG